MIPESKDEIFNTRGRILIHISANPDCTIRDLADALYLTPRTVWSLIGDLKRLKMLRIRKAGRRHLYTVDLDAPLPHPTVKGYTLYAILDHIDLIGRNERSIKR